MLNQTTMSVTNLYSQVLDGCRTKDINAVSGAIEILMKKSRCGSSEMLRFYRLCLLYLKLNRLDEVKKMFARLSDAWQLSFASEVAEEELKRVLDIEIESRDDDRMNLRTLDPVIARRLLKTKGVRLNTIEKPRSGKMLWNVTVNRRWLSRVMAELRVPHYYDFLNQYESRQLSFEF